MTTLPTLMSITNRSRAVRRTAAASVIACACIAFTMSAGVASAQSGRRTSGSQRTVTVSPQNSTMNAGSTKQFTAFVSFTPRSVTWEVNGIAGGNATVGTISSSGVYTAPVVVPVVNVMTVTARSTSRTSITGSASVTITRAIPTLSSVSPSPIAVGPYVATLNGTNFAPDSQALVNGAPIATTYVSSTRLTASASVAAPGMLTFAVRQPGAVETMSNSVSVSAVAPVVSVTVAPAATTLALGAAQAFTAALTGTTSAGVTWSVDGVAGGSATVGLITAAGVYTAPSVMPSSNTVTVQATSVASPTAFARASVTLRAPVAVTVMPSSTSVDLGTSRSFSAVVSGTTDTSVVWSVNGVTGGSSSSGTITTTGVYTAPAVMPGSSQVTIAAASATAGAVGQASLTLTSSQTSSSPSLAAARFLEQASFGPTPASLARVQSLGIDAYLDEQLNMPATPIPDFPDGSMSTLRNWMLFNYSRSPDQLRQRVAYSLSQIVVASGAKLSYSFEITPWLRLLSDHAFGNYRDLLRDVSVSASMGKYLDIANSMKAGMAGGANENYPRELMQLFTIGLVRLNQDGSVVLGSDGQPVPTYSQATVAQVARALTGWTYATAPGQTPRTDNWEYFGAPMETRPNSHDTSSKTFLGCTLPAGQSVEADLDGVIDCLMQHPNTAPFVATRLIRSLVTSNPSPQYIKRVADVFAGANGGVRGDLRATVRAILTDDEARQASASATGGRLKEPILHVAGFLRALDGGFSAGNGLSYMFDNMGQQVLTPPSVFSWFSPLFHVPNSPTFGPEFQIYTPSEAMQRGNAFYAMLTYPSGDYAVDLSPYQAYGSDVPGLVDQVNRSLLYGRMSPEMKQTLIAAATPGPEPKDRILTVLYLTALSGQYAVQH